VFPVELPVELALEEPFPLPDLHQADAHPRAQLASDASDAVHPDEALDAAHPALRDARYAEKLAAPEPVVLAQGARRRRPRPLRLQALMLPEPEPALCTRDAGRFAA
jgi:hypothetical protein